ncbi:SID1 transmembrane family member 1-like [Neocloeon triangulifer]|uniref:SID1 transmembrane family member 1-like n=1 Tax=Neocloeon triangulifer TaxID=2078957 RepID=UPI00286EC81A|nr:SID1 transmembrane family member 1-like [Neocloeon triangulifer]
MKVLWTLTLLLGVSAAADLTAIVINSQLGEKYLQEVNSTAEIIFLFSNVSQVSSKSPARISVESKEANYESPVLVVVRQQRGVLSWQIPYATERGSYTLVSRTLCPSSLFEVVTGDGSQENLIVSVSSSSHKNVNFTVSVDIEVGFEFGLDDERNTTVSPSQPRFFSFVFPDKVNTILLEAESSDSNCMTISLQERTCPVYDLEGTVNFEGSWQTMTKKGGITLTRDKFPNGFFLVLVVHGDDSACLTNTPLEAPSRHKSVSFSLRKKISYDEYLVATFGAFGVFAVFYVIAYVVAVLHQMSRRRRREAAANSAGECLLETHAEQETDVDPKSREEKLRRKVNAGESVFVSDMSRSGSVELRRSAQKYLWNILTVATFYGLPVVQLVITYQRVLNNTGNQDLCFYNFLCSHPVSVLSDFNHVFSNLGYGLLGLLFVMLVFRRERRHLKAVALNPALDSALGLPQQFGLFYALGAALIAEGVLSACYHVCPNQTNFQFDTSFMYVIAMMCMLRIYQNRHPDIHASAYTTFALLAVVILIGMCGVLTGTIVFWSIFTTAHLTLCLLLSAQVYFMGCWSFDLGIPARVWAAYTQPGLTCKARFLPVYPKRMALLILGILVNVGLSVVGLVYRPKNFASFLLAIFMANLNIYCWFYIIMKLVHRERISWPSLFHILASFVLWGLSLFYFFHRNISWQETPALSRTYNHPCDLLDFYDYHDVWHFLSAASMFFSFMVLLTLDDDLRLVPRTQISVF